MGRGARRGRSRRRRAVRCPQGAPRRDLRHPRRRVEGVHHPRHRWSKTRDGSPSLLARVPPDDRLIYVETLDPAGADEICASASEQCRVVQLTGAARASESTPILILERLKPTVSMVALDERLKTLRGEDALNSDDVFVLNGSTYPQFRTTSPVVFVRDPSIFDDGRSFLRRRGDDMQPCTARAQRLNSAP